MIEDQISKVFDEFMSVEGWKYETELELEKAFMQYFIKQIETNENFTKEESESIKLTFESLDKDDEEAIKLLKKAIKLNEYNAKAHIRLIELTTDTADELIEELEELIERFEDSPLEDEEDEIMEKLTDCLIELRKQLAAIYFEEDLYLKAEEEFMDLIRFSEYDDETSEFCRYLLAIYCHIGEFSLAKNLMKEYNNFVGNDESALLSYMYLAIMQGEDDIARSTLKKLIKVNGYAKKLLGDKYSEAEIIRLEARNSEFRKMIKAVEMIVTKLKTSVYFREWIELEIKKLNVENREVKIIKIKKDPEKENLEIFKGLDKKVVRILIAHNLYTLELFSEIAERDLLKIKGVGRTVVKKLKENGVKFRG